MKIYSMSTIGDGDGRTLFYTDSKEKASSWVNSRMDSVLEERVSFFCFNSMEALKDLFHDYKLIEIS